MVARDRDRVPVGDFLGAVRENIRDQAHRRLRRIDIRAARNVLLQDVVLDGAAQLRDVRTLSFGDGDVHGQQDRRRGVDGHRGRDLVERNLVEELRHVSSDEIETPTLPTSPFRDGIVGIVADLGRQVERHRQAGLSLLEQVTVALVRILRRWRTRRTGAWSRSGRGTWSAARRA